jgi:hypothetical protein
MNWEFGYWGGAINRWYEEGLPKVKGLPRKVSYGEGITGPGLHWPVPSFNEKTLRDYDISSFFNFDSDIDLVPFDYWIFPKYERQILRDV